MKNKNSRPSVPVSPNFSAGRFWNLDKIATTDKSFFDVLKWKFTSKAARWPEFIDDNVAPGPLERVASTQARITFINHATVLIQMNRLNIITDPVFSKRVSPFSFIGPKRHRAPGLTLDQLPPIDIVLISHGHYDHMDDMSLKAIEAKFRPRYFLPLQTGALLPFEAPDRVKDMDWWDEATISPDLEITFLPAQHWMARGLFDRNRSFWGSFMIKGSGATGDRAIYFAGDSGYGPHFKRIRERFGPVDFALLPIGAYAPRWFLTGQHMNPDDAVLAHLDLGATRSLGIHFGTFQLTDEAIDAPEKDLLVALKKYNISTQDFTAPRNGGSVTL